MIIIIHKINDKTVIIDPNYPTLNFWHFLNSEHKWSKKLNGQSFLWPRWAVACQRFVSYNKIFMKNHKVSTGALFYQFPHKILFTL